MSLPVHIVFAINADYYRQLQVLWASLFAQHEKGTLCFHVLHSGLSSNQETHLQSLAGRHRIACHLHHISPSRLRNLPVNEFFPSPVQYHRLFISEYISPDVSRVLYLDTDTIVCRNLAPLLENDLQGCAVGAVEDLDATASCARLGIPRTPGYFNSGMLVIDPQAWARNDIPGRVLEYLGTHRHDPSKWKYPDQDALNMALQRLWNPLPLEWNVFVWYRLFQPGELSPAQRSAILHPGILHYTGPEKPWLFPVAPPYKNRYRHYAHRAGVRFPASFSLQAFRERWKQERRLQTMRTIHQAAGLQNDF